MDSIRKLEDLRLMPKIVCVDCGVDFRIEKTGANAVDMFQTPPVPYKITSCDAWKCPGCGKVVLAGFASYPTVEHFQPEFNQYFLGIERKEWTIKVYERVSDRPKGENNG